MYRIYTSYFSNRAFKKQKDAYKIPVCATLQTENTFTKWYNEIAPDIELIQQFSKIPTKTKKIRELFTHKYLKKLNRLREEGILDKYVEELRELVKYNDVYLLCYERPNQFCHRQILANYLNKYYQMNISEY